MSGRTEGLVFSAEMASTGKNEELWAWCYKLKLNTTASSNSFLLMKPSYTSTELESAINYWRTRTPSTGEEQSLCPQSAALAETYALMIFNARPEINWQAIKPASQAALSAWDEQTGGHQDASRA